VNTGDKQAENEYLGQRHCCCIASKKTHATRQSVKWLSAGLCK